MRKLMITVLDEDRSDVRFCRGLDCFGSGLIPHAAAMA